MSHRNRYSKLMLGAISPVFRQESLAGSLRTLTSLGLCATDVFVPEGASPAELRDVRQAFTNENVTPVILPARHGLLTTDHATREANIQAVCQAMSHAELAGAMAVVGSPGTLLPDPPTPAAPCRENFTDRAMDQVVQGCLDILRETSHLKVSFCLEPWVVTTLNTPRAVRTLLERVDHPRMKILFDPVNLMSLERYFDSTNLINECFELFGPQMVCIHAKDSVLRDRPFTYHMSEAIPGRGELDYETLLTRTAGLPAQPPLVIEHLATLEEIVEARDYITSVAKSIGIEWHGR